LAAAWLAYQCHRDYDAALSELAIAERTLPNDSSVPALTGLIARRQAHWQKCLTNSERAIELDPRNLWTLQQTAQTYWLLRRFSDMARILDRALLIPPTNPSIRVARALVDLESDAAIEPAYEVIQDIVVQDPSVVDSIAEYWLYIALCRRDFAEAARALASIPPEGIVPFNTPLPRSFCQGLAGRAKGDTATAEQAFDAARSELEAVVNQQQDYAQAWSVLGMANAGLGRKDDALRAGRYAVELLPIAKDAMTGAELLTNLAIIYAWTGEKELALNQLEELLPRYGPISYGQLRLHPSWDPLRDDPRFERIVEEAKKPVTLK
jgi:serine/threonine-protein kinase